MRNTKSMAKTKKINQQQIKTILIDEIIKDNNCIVCSEIPFMSGKRWADLVVLKKNSIIAYEIKSEVDSLTKLPEQIKDYITTFDKVYLVVSKKFKNVLLSGKFNKKFSQFKNTGLWVFDNNNIIKEREAIQKNPPKKINLCHFLWKKDLQKYLKQDKNLNDLRKSFVQKKNVKEIKKIVISCLKERYKKRFDIFLHDRHNRTHEDDLHLLTNNNLQIN